MPIYRTETLSNRHIDTRQHKAKKQYLCDYCNVNIPKGTTYTKTIGTLKGHFISRTWHRECYEHHTGYVKDEDRKA